MIKPENVQKVIDTLKIIEDRANVRGKFDINEPKVQMKHHKCGTVHCVAGWYAVARQDDPIIDELIKNDDCRYEDGVALISEDLQIKYFTGVDGFMRDHPQIWGNDDGGYMFTDIFAYNNLDFDSKNPMSIIINHWEQVKKNVEKLQSAS